MGLCKDMFSLGRLSKKVRFTQYMPGVTIVDTYLNRVHVVAYHLCVLLAVHLSYKMFPMVHTVKGQQTTK